MLAGAVHIPQTIVFGVVFDPKNNDRVRGMNVDGLFASVGALFDLLETRGIDYVLVGGVAMLAYVEGRNTQDIDLILSHKDLAKLPELVVEDQNQEFGRGKLGELQVDLLFTRNKLFKRVASLHTTRKRFADREAPCATEEGLLLLKLFALPSLYRQGRFDKVDTYERDVAALMRHSAVDALAAVDSLTDVLAPADIDELRQIVAEIAQRQADAAKRFRGHPGSPPPA
ncbi:hypothetical protein Pla175_44260 [Pirellulimonas nuda]|uniref:Nucleotidyl transferase AbiEii toxin, Type IV TA system n=1 Tax=Pirellulimonas nuda TaxID=2528009 RepID=A0A518DHQ4_9BACT|nr:hypothetical protein [Pirellulimonas nuda]QDU91010.1 hypothetical protein Pla175_44260 [Pirellulimonas nuda]